MAMLLALAAPAAGAGSWHCRNTDLEVACADGRCQAAEAGTFTPMDVAFDDAGALSVCAYSGCWDGTGEVGGDARFLTVVARGLPFSTAPEGDDAMRADVALLLDRDGDVALLRVAAYAQPFACTRRD